MSKVQGLFSLGVLYISRARSASATTKMWMMTGREHERSDTPFWERAAREMLGRKG